MQAKKKKSNKAKKNVLLLGAGGWAREHWITNVWPDFTDDVEIVGLVDNNKDVLVDSASVLQLKKNQIYTNIVEAFQTVKPDFCVVVLPPHIHKVAYKLALASGIPILSEKPITDTYEDTLKVYEAVKRKKLKMAVIQNYRYEGPIMTLKKILDSKELGRIDYIVARYASDYRKPGAWDVGSVYEMDNPLLVEGSIHHFDMIRYLSGANCESVQGIGWSPTWASFKSDSSALNIMVMENGVKAIYEGNSNEAGNINRWHQEYYRVECEKGSVVVNRDKTVRIYRRDNANALIVTIPPILSAPPSGHHKIVRDFLTWLDGGAIPETHIGDNIQSAMMVFAAIDANKSGLSKKIQDYIP